MVAVVYARLIDERCALQYARASLDEENALVSEPFHFQREFAAVKAAADYERIDLHA